MKKSILILFAALSLTACKKTTTSAEETSMPLSEISDINEIIAPPGFNYETSKSVEFAVNLFNNSDQPLSGIRIDIMDKTPEEGGKILYTGTTNANGRMLVKREMPLDVKQVIVNTDYIGLPNNVIMNLESGRGTVTIGGKNPQRIITADVNMNRPTAPLGKNQAKFSYRLGQFHSGSGVPKYLMPTNDAISSNFLGDVNASLPERQPVPTFRPEYLTSNAEKNLVLKEQCDVWITFVHEGAGYQNSLFFFVYNVNNKPTSISQVDSFISIFPNASYSGSGGGLNSGNKVHIGRFGADTAIGFAIAANGWNGTNVGNGYGLYTSIKSMNPETNPAFQEHVVLLYDNPTQRFLIGFEDINRMPSMSSDNDFNDVIIYATANPVKAIQSNNIPPVTPSNDTDDDGVSDTYDEYPNDAARAFNIYYPSQAGMATVAFEDLWPSKGDYDLNDVVVAYQYHAVTNGNNEIKDLNAKFKLRAAGGVFKNGFSVAFPFNRSNVTLKEGSTVVGLEAEANEAILKVFNNSKAIIGTYNTLAGKSFAETDTLVARMTLTTAIEATVGTFNPFIYVNEAQKGRGFEVHLPGKAPSSLVNSEVLGTNADATNPSAGVFYKTTNGLPFAISIPETFDYPLEKEQIINAHLKFAAWVQSGGSQFPDWYKNLSGNRNNAKIYTKP